MKTVDKKRVATARGGRRRNSRWMGQLFRGLVLEGLGMAVLAYLFITIQSGPPNSFDGSRSDAIEAESSDAPSMIQAEGSSGKNTAYQTVSRDLANKLIPPYYGAAFWNIGR